MKFAIFNLTLSFPDYILQLGCASLFGLMLGYERALHRKVASFTTFSLLSLGSCILTHLSVEMSEAFNSLMSNAIADPMRIPSYILASIGFASAGVIFKDHDSAYIEGVTTAVMMWLAASIGMCCGFGRLDLAFWGVVLYFIILRVARISHNVVDKFDLIQE